MQIYFILLTSLIHFTSISSPYFFEEIHHLIKNKEGWQILIKIMMKLPDNGHYSLATSSKKKQILVARASWELYGPAGLASEDSSKAKAPPISDIGPAGPVHTGIYMHTVPQDPGIRQYRPPPIPNSVLGKMKRGEKN